MSAKLRASLGSLNHVIQIEPEARLRLLWQNSSAQAFILFNAST